MAACGELLTVKAEHDGVLIGHHTLVCERDTSHEGPHQKAWGERVLEWPDS